MMVNETKLKTHIKLNSRYEVKKIAQKNLYAALLPQNIIYVL